MIVTAKKDYIASLNNRRNYVAYKKDIFINIDYDICIVDEIVDFYLKYRSYIDKHMKIERPDLFEYVIDKTKSLDIYNSNFITRLKFVMECRKHIPKCAECGCDLDLSCVKPTHDWPNFCCKKHSAINVEFMKRRADMYFNKTGYRH